MKCAYTIQFQVDYLANHGLELVSVHAWLDARVSSRSWLGLGATAPMMVTTLLWVAVRTGALWRGWCRRRYLKRLLRWLELVVARRWGRRWWWRLVYRWYGRYGREIERRVVQVLGFAGAVGFGRVLEVVKVFEYFDALFTFVLFGRIENVFVFL